MKKVFGKPESLSSKPNMYCPGCGHGLAHRLAAEAIDSLGLKDRCMGVASVGCSVFADDYFDFDFIQAAHGRAPAVATGMKRSKPDCIVFTHQGDGDLASIGAAVGVGKVGFEEVCSELWPFLVVDVMVILLLVFIPELSLAIPRAIGFI